MKVLNNVMVYFLCFNFTLIGTLSARETLKASGKELDMKLRELKSKTSTHGQLREKLLRNIDKQAGHKVLEAYGVDKEEFKLRLMAMSEGDLRQMLENKNQVGGDVVVISLSTLFIIIILLLLID